MTRLSIYQRRLDLVRFALFPNGQGDRLRAGVNAAYRRDLAARAGVASIHPDALVNWDTLDLHLSRPTSNLGQVSHLELLILCGMARQRLQPGQNFLEIGTFDGSTALNVSLNLPQGSKLITVDLPEGTALESPLPVDVALVAAPERARKKHLGQPNIQQVYADSTTLDFSRLSFNGAFIDGGHDYRTVSIDSGNVLQFIQRPGFILWHDYDVECPIGDVLHGLAKQHPIRWIEGTRMAVLELP